MANTAPAIVVGVDGSRAGTQAALWAVDEAIGRELPLRLLGAAEHGDAAAAEAAVRAAAAEVQATGRAVRVETEVAAAGPTLALLEASRTAALLCVGDIGLRHAEHARIGSTTAALVASAHCPVAVVRGVGVRGPVVVALDPTPASAAVLQFAVGEARLRAAPLRVLGAWQSDEHDAQTVAESGRQVRVELDRRIDHWRRRYPDLHVLPVAVHGGAVDYLAEHAAEVQLMVAGGHDSATIDGLLGPAGAAALRESACSILVVDRQRLL